MIRTAVAQNNRFDQGRPVKVVNVIQRRTPGDQSANNFVMTKMGSGDQRGSVIDASCLVPASGGSGLG